VETLEKVQIRAINMVNGLVGTYAEKLEQLGMQTLAQRREEADLVLVYKILTKKCAIDGEKWFEIEDVGSGPNTISAATGVRIRPPFARTDTRKNFFTVRVCDKWNNLPATVKCAKNIANFRSAYRLLQLDNRRRRGTRQGDIKTPPTTTDEQRPHKDLDGSLRTSQQVSSK
jgi:hypothetical protein